MPGQQRGDLARRTEVMEADLGQVAVQPKYRARHNRHANAGCGAGNDGVIRAQLQHPARRAAAGAKPGFEPTAVIASGLERQHGAGFQVGRTVDGGMALARDQHQLFLERRQRRQRRVVQRLRHEGTVHLEARQRLQSLARGAGHQL